MHRLFSSSLLRKLFPASLAIKRENLPADLTAGATFAIVNVPQAMGNAVLAGVNPVFGLYALIVAAPVGALFTSSIFMNVSTTGALSVAAGDALFYVADDQKTLALVTLVFLIGAFQLLFGVLKLGNMIRFVSHSVMTGFITGIALLIVLGQIDDLTGYSSRLNNSVLQLADLLLNLNQIKPLTFIVGVITIGLIVGFGYTRLNKYALVLALAVVTLLNTTVTALTDIGPTPLVADIATIPRSLPYPMLPGLELIYGLLLPAMAIAIIGLVQGAGVGQSYPNPDGKYPDVSRDFSGQGVANIATGLFQGIPCGGSMSGTAVSVNAGAKSRWSNIFAGLFVAVIVLLFIGIVKLIPMSALAGLLVVVGFQNIRPRDVILVWHTNRIARVAMLLTLLATLTIPLQFAILVGVAISILLHVIQSSNQIRVTEFVPVEGGFPVEKPVPVELSSHQTTVLFPYGSLFFASASTFEKSLPKVGEAQRAVVILILRGQTEMGSTLIGVLRRYSEALQTNGGRLMLVGVSSELRDQLDRTDAISAIGEQNLFMAKAELGTAMNEAISTAQIWLEQQPESQATP